MIEQFAINIEQVKAADLGDIKKILSEEKIARVERFRFEADQVRGIVGEALVRCLLGEKYGMEAADIRFGYGEKEKPCLLLPHGDVDFNISHAGSWVVCGIGNSGMGIDVELVREREVPLAKAVLTAEEYRAWSGLPAEEQNSYFYRHWTLKEAYVKYLGVGLSMDFSGILPESQADGFYSIRGDADCILFSQRLASDYPLSICIEREKKEELVTGVTVLTVEELQRFVRNRME